MKKIILTISFLALVLDIQAQSGRVKPLEKPTPEPSPRPRVVYVPTQTNTETAKPVTSPTPKIKTDEADGDVIRVDSTLVPIPVSVTDVNGRVVTNLRLEDFTLEI